LAHSNARFSKPSGPSETPAVLIRIWHLGQRGRWIGNSSGSGFFELAIIVKNSENPKMRLFVFDSQIQFRPFDLQKTGDWKLNRPAPGRQKRQLGSEKQGVNLCDVTRLKYP